MRPTDTDQSGQRQAIDDSRHVYVSEEQLDVGIRCQYFERPVTVHSLDHAKPSVLENIDRREADQSLVFDDKNHALNFLGGHGWQ